MESLPVTPHLRAALRTNPTRPLKSNFLEVVGSKFEATGFFGGSLAWVGES